MSATGKLAVTAVVVVMAIPGLVIEPGPLSEIAALGILAAVWLGDKSAEEAVTEAASEAAGGES
jgi:hypothetical protein